MIEENVYPFNINDISTLLEMEDKLKKNEKKNFIIPLLIQSYAKLIEFYDERKDPIKIYFLDKMQSILCGENPELEDNTESEKKIFETEKKVIEIKKVKKKIEIVNKIEKKKNLSKIKKIKTTLKNKKTEKSEKLKKNRVELNMFEIRKNRRFKNAILNNKIQIKKIQIKNKIENNLNSYTNKSDKKTKIIYDNLKSQENEIKKKLKLRRKNSLARSKASFLSISNTSKSIFLKNSLNEKKNNLSRQETGNNFNNILDSIDINLEFKNNKSNFHCEYGLD